ncbi:MAG: aminotransferase class V-fold PLP-dependent enzyme [Halobacteriaceae archaeon]
MTDEHAEERQRDGTSADDTIYDELGVTTVVNARGSMTALGGSLLPPEVVEAMDRAAGSFVRMEELLDWAGREVAAVTGAEAGLVTTGAAGGLVLAAAACITGRDRELMERIPDTAGVADEFVVQHHHDIDYARGLRTAGGRTVVVGDESGASVEQLEAAIGEETAALFHAVLDPQPTVSLAAAADVAHDRGVPVVVDAAAELPPPENLHEFLDDGADLVAFSGGKNVRGPNDTGLLVGRADLVEAARMQAFPNHGIGRALKVSKEQIVGQVTALKRWADRDHDERRARWRAAAERVCERVGDLPGVEATVAFPESGPRPLTIPRARVTVDEATVGRDADAVGAALKEGTPPVAVALNGPSDVLWVNPEHLREGEEEVVARRLRSVLGG